MFTTAALERPRQGCPRAERDSCTVAEGLGGYPIAEDQWRRRRSRRPPGGPLSRWRMRFRRWPAGCPGRL